MCSNSSDSEKVKSSPHSVLIKRCTDQRTSDQPKRLVDYNRLETASVITFDVGNSDQSIVTPTSDIEVSRHDHLEVSVRANHTCGVVYLGVV